MPWRTVIKESTDTLELWLQELQEPAMAYARARADLELSWAHQQGDQDRKGKGKWQPGKGGHPRMKAGRFLTNHDGKELCFKFNVGACNSDECPRAHQCSKCLGPHQAGKCFLWKKKGKGKKGRGKGGSQDGDARQDA